MGTCPTNTDGSLTPFVAKYCTALGFDMDMMRTMSGQEMICAMSEKLNETVCFDNKTREMQEQLENEWEEFENNFVTNVQGPVNNAVNQLYEDGKLTVPQSVIVTFGDSFGDEDGEWPDLLAAKFGCTADAFNVGGETWPLENQVNACAAKYPDEESRSKIAFAVAYAGINTAVFGPIANTNNIQSFINNFNQKMPGVKLYVAPINSCNPLYSSYPNAYRYVIQSAQNLYRQMKGVSGNYILLPYSHLYNTGATGNLWQSDYLHPSQQGEIVLANNMASAICGGGYYFGYNAFSIPSGFQETQYGYGTQYGIVTPEITVTNYTGGTLAYYYSMGLYIPNTHLRARVYSSDTEFTYNFENCTIYSDKNNPQWIISIPSSVSFTTKLVLEPQFVPFGYPPLKEQL